MSLTESQRFHLKKFIKELENFKGRHTELVSVYIPQDYDLNKIINHLAQEQGTASNIKSSSTRKNVTDALERMIQHLKLFKRTPPNGLCVFSGNVAEREGQQDFKVWSIEPPIPLKTRIYRCDKEFVLDILRDMMEVKEVYGLVVMDRRDANIALLKGKSIIPLVKTHSEVPGKFKAGGQCNVFGTLIQSASGDILKIENSHNPIVVKSLSNDDYSIRNSPITDKWVTKKQKIYKIRTKYPQLVVETSKDHLFLVSTIKGVIEKPAEELKFNDILLMPERIDIHGKAQKLRPDNYYNSFIIKKTGQNLIKDKRSKKKLLQRELAKLIGVTQTTISSYEIGKLHIERLQLKKLCDLLELNIEIFIDRYSKPFNQQSINLKLPRKVNKNLAQFLGYFIGDGNFEEDRVTFSEQRKEVALYYKKKYGNFFGLDVNYRFRESKNYYQLRFTSRPLVRFIKSEFQEIKKTMDSEVPKKILESKDEIVASFLRGYFDAEGFVNKKYSVGIASNNKTLIGQVHLLLLRFSIIASFIEYDNKRNPYSNNPIFKLQINDKISLKNFKKYIGFSSKDKQKSLKILIKEKSNIGRTRQILTSGVEVKNIIEKAGYNLKLFPKVSDFFRNKRMMSKQVFKNSILCRIKDEKLFCKLMKIYNCPILPVKINKIEVIKKETKMVDISVKSQNFIANGLIVHNSAMRFHRLIEGAAKDHYKKVGEYMKEAFLNMEGLKGIIVGGPGPTKYDFVEGGYITNEVKKKIIAIKDLSYTEEFGLEELLEKSQDVLAAEDVVEEKKIVNRFLETLATKQKMVSYGEADVMNKIRLGVVDTVLLSEDLPDKKIEEFEAAAKPVGTNIRIISTQTREGAQLRDLGKVAAILRYEYHG